MSIAKSIVVPCYNEAANLPALISRFEALHKKGADWELVLVNNGSTDDSREVLKRELAKPGRKFVRVVEVPSPNVGYGHGILSGLQQAKGKWLAWTHADGQTPPADVITALDRLEKSGERTFVKGKRQARPLRDELLTRGMQAAAGMILGVKLEDINAQPKAFPRGLLDQAVNPPTDLSLDLYFFWLARTQGYKVETVDVQFGQREHGESKWAFNWRSKGRHISRALKYMVQLRRARG
jgi:glycosyltransferase involved in cell wall biosynthesis